MNMEERICKALLDLMESTPYADIRVTDVVRKAGISRSTFYKYYQSTHEVLEQIEEELIDVSIVNRPVAADMSRREIMVLSDKMRANIRAFNILSGPNGPDSFLKRLIARNRNSLLSIAEQTDSHVTATELQAISEFSTYGKIRVLQWWAEHEQYVSVYEMAVILDKIHRSIVNMLTM